MIWKGNPGRIGKIPPCILKYLLSLTGKTLNENLEKKADIYSEILTFQHLICKNRRKTTESLPNRDASSSELSDLLRWGLGTREALKLVCVV